MSLSSRSLRLSVSAVLVLFASVCAAQQNPQFLNIPQIERTGNRVTSLLTGILQQPPSRTDILYVNAPVASGTSTSVTVGELLSGQGAQGFTNLVENQITFSNVTGVVAALGDFNGDGNVD